MENYYFNTIVKSKFGLALLALCTVFVSCKDIVEEDISQKMVQMIIPTSDDTIETNLVHFKWHEIEDADAYRLQIVSPSFDNINTFDLDSAVVGLEFYHSLNPGTYQFQIRGENSVYQSIYAGPYTFVVDSVSDLSSQLVPLLTPANGIYTNLTDATLTWQNIFAATTYEVQVRAGADFNASSSTLLTASNIYSTAYITTGAVMPAEAAYSWGVSAFNSSSQSSFSSRTIYVDLTIPNDVSLLAPTDAFNNPDDAVTFKWSSGTDPGTINAPISYVFEIDTDAGFGAPTVHTPTPDSLQLTLATGTHFWRVYALDEAGNQSDIYSSVYSVIIP